MPFEQPWSEVKAGDLIYGLQKPRDAFWKRCNQKGIRVYLMEQFYVINNDSTSYKRADERITEGFKLALQQHPKFGNFVPEEPETGGEFANADVRAKDKGGIEWAAQSGRSVHFILDELNLLQVIEKNSTADINADNGGGFLASEKERGITGAELRWIYRNRFREKIQDAVQFWLTQKSTLPEPVVPPWYRGYPDGKIRGKWDLYKPKNVPGG